MTTGDAAAYLDRAQRLAGEVADLGRDTPIRPIERVGIIGAGTMGGGIAMNFLSAGVPVTLVETAPEPLGRGATTMRRNYDATAAKGRLTTDQVEAAMALLAPTLEFGELAACDLVIEAAYEDLAVKRDIFARLDRVAKDGAILASNTSYLSIDEIAAATGRPSEVIGLHFFSPANVMKLVEVVRGDRTAPDVLATGMAVARQVGKVPVVARVCYGFIGNRMLIPRQTEATKLILEGATPEQVDAVHLRIGMPMGPFQMADLAGVDIGWHRDPERIESLSDALNAVGRWGQKTTAGYYDYDDGRRPTPSPVTSRILDHYRERSGIEPRAIDDEEIVARTLYTMVNEAALILEEGIAQRASDIDVVFRFGYGWPVTSAGPMRWADETGLDRVVAGLQAHRGLLDPDFRLAPLLQQLASAGGRFTGEAPTP